MARKMTDAERAMLPMVRDGLSPVIPPAKRGAASGIASAIVRRKNQSIDDGSLDKLLQKYELDSPEMKEQIAKAVLEWHEDEGVYQVNAWIRQYAEEQVALAEEKASEEADRDDASEVSADEPASEASETEVPDEEAKPRRRRRTRKTKAETAEEPVLEETSSEAEVPAEETEVPEEEAKPRRRRRTRKPKTEAAENPSSDAADVDAAAEAEASAEEAPAEEAEVSEEETKPRRRRRRARKAKTETPEETLSEEAAAEAAVEQEESGEAPEAEAPKRSRRRRRHARKTSDAPVQEDEPAGDAPEVLEELEELAGGEEAEPEDEDLLVADEAPAAAVRPPNPSHSRDLRKIPYVRRGGEMDAETRLKIVSLDARFWMNGWLLSHPKAYSLFEDEIVKMNDILQDGMLPGDITRRQLAYQMGGDEKFFEYGNDGYRLLRALGMEDIIRHRPMPKSDLVYHAPRRRKRMRVLVTENLDPYLDVHDLMYEDGRSTILGERIHAVVLGSGTPIVEHNRLSLLLDTLGADSIEVLYWGDIDRAGLSIMQRLEKELDGRYEFRPFAPAYQLMVDKAQERFPDPLDNESTKQVNVTDYDLDPLCAVLTPAAADYARAVVDSCELIPQEILTKQDL